MKISKVLFLLVIVISSCQENIPKNCVQADWVGIYSGTIDCENSSYSTTVVIKASGSEAIALKHTHSDGLGDYITDYDEFVPKRCSFDFSSEIGMNTVESSLTLVDGDLSITETVFNSTGSSTCTLTVSKN